MIRRTYLIENEIGLHARPAAVFVDYAGDFNSEIKLCYQGKEVNAKSIISVLSLGLGKGDVFTLIVEGEDDESALKTLEDFILNNIGQKKDNLKKENNE